MQVEPQGSPVKSQRALWTMVYKQRLRVRLTEEFKL